ncbi:hypothetical protein [Terricaulis silvestris]|uniref:hypothetical protein n=1 Tax=Terricaulis silvestris TaxID=2686094 RepID=UPI00131C8CBD|nr:hypothetical protein [Terricaulis silvestris]
MTSLCSHDINRARLLELAFLVDRALHARLNERIELSDALIHAAQALLRASLRAIGNDIALVASRKTAGNHVGMQLAQRLSPEAAAAVSVVWLLRRARQPAIKALAVAFRSEARFQETVWLLCKRLFV